MSDFHQILAVKATFLRIILIKSRMSLQTGVCSLEAHPQIFQSKRFWGLYSVRKSSLRVHPYLYPGASIRRNCIALQKGDIETKDQINIKDKYALSKHLINLNYKIVMHWVTDINYLVLSHFLLRLWYRKYVEAQLYEMELNYRISIKLRKWMSLVPNISNKNQTLDSSKSLDLLPSFWMKPYDLRLEN